jgi:hypothetical protein
MTAIDDRDDREAPLIETLEELRSIEATLEGTSPAPWEADIDDPGQSTEGWTAKFYTGSEQTGNEGTWCTYNTDEPWTIANARFCASARTNVPRLTRTVRVLMERSDETARLRAELAETRATLEAERAAHAQLDAMPAAGLLYIATLKEEGHGETILWWRPRGAGYTTRLDEAGQYTAEEARAAAHERSNVALPCAEVDALAVRVVASHHLETLRTHAPRVWATKDR